ncbi:hypothetical protein [Rhizobium grahamii]|nr:hypothetical protein [Rhizobium grahamii]
MPVETKVNGNRKLASSIRALTMKNVAESTLRRGYTHFRLEDVLTSSSPLGVNATFRANVRLFHANDAGAKGAFNAAEVLKNNGKV